MTPQIGSKPTGPNGLIQVIIGISGEFPEFQSSRIPEHYRIGKFSDRSLEPLERWILGSFRD